MRAAAAGGLLLAALAAACAAAPAPVPFAGRVARVALVPGEDPVRVRWPEPYRRAARFEIENLTGADVATLILDLSRNPRPPRELVEAVVEEPAGAACSTMAHPGGQWNLRALVGTPGTVLLRPGAKLTLLVRVEGDPGDSVATVTIPGVTRE